MTALTMRTLHIVSTGTSIVTNLKRELEKSDPSANLNAALDLGKLFDFLVENPAKASAEINSLDSRTQLLASAGKRDDLSVTILHSTTDQGQRAADVLQRFLKGRVGQIQTLPFMGFDRPADANYSEVDAKSMAEKSLGDLKIKTAEHITKMREQCDSVEINCTGGFKAEAAILYSVGLKLKVPVYYMHESFRCCVELPHAE